MNELRTTSFGFLSSALDIDPSRVSKPSIFSMAMGTSCVYTDYWLGNGSANSTITTNILSKAHSVYNNGRIDRHPSWADHGNGIRPAICLNLASNQYSYAGTVCSDGSCEEIKRDDDEKEDENKSDCSFSLEFEEDNISVKRYDNVFVRAIYHAPKMPNLEDIIVTTNCTDVEYMLANPIDLGNDNYAIDCVFMSNQIGDIELSFKIGDLIDKVNIHVVERESSNILSFNIKPDYVCDVGETVSIVASYETNSSFVNETNMFKWSCNDDSAVSITNIRITRDESSIASTEYFTEYIVADIKLVKEGDYILKLEGGGNSALTKISSVKRDEIEYTGLLMSYADLKDTDGFYEVMIDQHNYVSDEYFNENIDIANLWTQHGSCPFYVTFSLKSEKLHSIKYKSADITNTGENVYWSDENTQSPENKIITDAIYDYEKQFNELMGQVCSDVNSEVEKEKKENNQATEILVSKLKEHIACFTFEEDWPSNWSKEEIYKTFAEKIIEIADKKCDLSNIRESDVASFDSKVVNSILKSFVVMNEVAESSDKTKVFSFNIYGMYGVFTGEIKCHSKKNPNICYTVVITMSEEQMKKALNGFADDLFKLNINVKNMVYS